MKRNIARSILFSLVFFLCTYVVMAIVSVLIGGIINLPYLIPAVKLFLPQLILSVITYYVMIVVVLPWLSDKMIGDDLATVSLAVRIGSCLVAVPPLILLTVAIIINAPVISSIICIIMSYKMFRFGRIISFCAPGSLAGNR